MPLIEQEYYEKYKEIIDQCIPKDVLNRLLGKTLDGNTMGDAWEPPTQSKTINDGVKPPWED